MADLVKSNSSGSESRLTSRLLRYPLRSSMKSREEKPAQADTPNSGSASRREKIASSVSKSVDVLDLSGKEKSAKPPRRLSSPMKSPVPKSCGNVTPTSDARMRSSVSFGKNTTPLSDFWRSSACRRFDLLLSASYWLSQIKLSESAAKHSVSLGFFKLALEAGCEPLQRMSEELKSYAQRHNLAELSETVKEVFRIYGLSTENIHPSSSSQVSETSSEVHDKISKTSSSIDGDGVKQKPKSLDMNVCDSSSTKTGKSLPRNAVYAVNPINKNPQKQAIKDKVKKKQGKKTSEEKEEAATLDSRPEDDKENKGSNDAAAALPHMEVEMMTSTGI